MNMSYVGTCDKFTEINRFEFVWVRICFLHAHVRSFPHWFSFMGWGWVRSLSFTRKKKHKHVPEKY